MDAIGYKLLGISSCSCSVHASDYLTWHVHVREIGKFPVVRLWCVCVCVSVCYHTNSLLHTSFIRLKCCFVDLVLLFVIFKILVMWNSLKTLPSNVGGGDFLITQFLAELLASVDKRGSDSLLNKTSILYRQIYM